MKVHQLLMNFIVAELAEQWIKDLTPRVNGRLDMEALQKHYGGKGNASRRIATAEKLRESLHYKSERSPPIQYKPGYDAENVQHLRGGRGATHRECEGK